MIPFTRRTLVPHNSLPSRIQLRRLMALALFLVLQGSPFRSTAQTSQPPHVKLQRSQRVSAAIAVGLGYEMQEWLTSAQNPPTDEKDISALQLKDTVVQKAASMLGVVLNPLPAQARQAFPKETLKRMQYAFDTIDRWRSQVHDGLLGDAYLQSHYLIGETVGYLRRFLATNYRPSESAQSVVNKVVSVANEEMASSQVDMSEQLRAQWLDIVDKLKALDKLSPETAVSLRSRLGSWYWAFLTELNGKPL